MNYKTLFLLSLCLVACDSGDIEERTYSVQDTGRVVQLTARVSGIRDWADGYSVALAGFAKDDNYATMQRALPAATADGTEVELVLNNVTDGIETVELAITNNLRKRIVTLESIVMADYEDSQDTIHMVLGDIDLDLFGCLQYGVFDKACIQCHGGNGRMAAGLDLTRGNARKSLVDVASTRKPGMFRVVSGNAGASLLHQILNPGGENILGYNHTEVVSSQFKATQDSVRSLIDKWINQLPEAE